MVYRIKKQEDFIMKTSTTALCEAPKTPMKKVQGFFAHIGKRNIIIACCVLLIGTAVWLNWVLISNDNVKDGYDGYDQPSGNVSATPGDTTNADSTYFSATQINRQKARDEALEVLQSVVDSTDADEAMKNEALESISAIADEIQKESNIESLITAKGFAQCVAVLNGDTACIVVSADDLQVAQIAQINAIVYEQTGILPSAVTIIHK